MYLPSKQQKKLRGWVGFQKSYVITRVGHGKCLRLLTRWVGGVKKGLKHAYVIFEWSLVKCYKDFFGYFNALKTNGVRSSFERKFNKTNFISPKKHLPNAWVLGLKWPHFLKGSIWQNNSVNTIYVSTKYGIYAHYTLQYTSQRQSNHPQVRTIVFF